MQGGPSKPEPWRERLSRKLSTTVLVGVLGGCVLIYATSTGSTRLFDLASFVLLPAALLLLGERFLKPRRFPVTALLTIAVILVVGLSGMAVVGVLGGPAGTLFLAVIFTSLLLEYRATLAVLVFIAASTATIGWAIVSGRLPPPAAADVSFSQAHVWVRTAGVWLVLVGVGSVVCLLVVRELEQALDRVRREAAEREQAQRERTRALEAALQAQKVEVVGRLAAGLAHDLNNALFVIAAWNQSLQSEPLTEAERAETHAEIEFAVQQSSSMVGQLLSFARKHVASPEPLSTRAVLEDLRNTFKHLFPADVKVVVECARDAVVHADKVQLQQAILNLAINARDAMPAGGELTVRADVVVLAEPLAGARGDISAGRYATFEVRDTGAGMDESTRAHAFDLLFTTKPEGKGTGLGLASVLSTAQMSGGNATLWSEPGRGTRVMLYLPLVDTFQAERERVSRPHHKVDLRGVTVLVVEDSPDALAVLRRGLEDKGCVVLEARDGTQALEQIGRSTRPIDVLCADAVMPGAPVRDVIDRLREKYPDAGVLVISGYVADELTRRGIEQGLYRVLAKPFEMHRLFESIAELRPRGGASASGRNST